MQCFVYVVLSELLSRKAKAYPYLADTSPKHGQVLGTKGSVLLCSMALEEVALMVAHAARGPGNVPLQDSMAGAEDAACFEHQGTHGACPACAAAPCCLTWWPSGDNPVPGPDRGVKRGSACLQP